jgi:hypothetical protein
MARLRCWPPGHRSSPASTAYRLTAAGRRRLTAALANPTMTSILTALATHRIGVPPDLQWQLADDPGDHNDSWGASYDCVLTAPDGRPAIHGRLRYYTPQLRSTEITSLVDVELDIDACRPVPHASAPSPAGPLSVPEIVDTLTTAWALAFDTLPLALDTGTGVTAGRPRASLYVINQRSPTTGKDPAYQFGDLVDLSVFGTTTKTFDRLSIVGSAADPYPSTTHATWSGRPSCAWPTTPASTHQTSSSGDRSRPARRRCRCRAVG